jgi:CDGSH-type Zn-finger protein
MDDAPAITIESNGPYRVRGAKLVRTAQVETEHGEPVGWAPDEPVAAPAEVKLCRCGRSSNKPFCDRSHERVGFDGTEAADRGSGSERRKTYPGDGVVMTDDRSICEHAGFCGDRFTNVWRMTRETDDPAVRERLIAMVRNCPSGALDYSLEPGADPIEPELPTGIAIVRDGPLWVRGGVPITGANGVDYEVRNRVTLCRCGASTNKPLCDGTHREIGFTDG